MLVTFLFVITSGQTTLETCPFAVPLVSFGIPARHAVEAVQMNSCTTSEGRETGTELPAPIYCLMLLCGTQRPGRCNRGQAGQACCYLQSTQSHTVLHRVSNKGLALTSTHSHTVLLHGDSNRGQSHGFVIVCALASECIPLPL